MPLILLHVSAAEDIYSANLGSRIVYLLLPIPTAYTTQLPHLVILRTIASVQRFLRFVIPKRVEVEHLLWIPGSVNLAGPLTKYNPTTLDLLMSVLNQGRIPTDLLSRSTVMMKP